MIAGAFSSKLLAQKDVTSQYITNATLSSLNGWTTTYTKDRETNDPANAFSSTIRGNNTTGYATEAYAGWGELIQTEYAIKQTIKLPAGHYTLVCYAFFRQGDANDADHNNATKAYLKAGENSVPLKTLRSIPAASYANNQAEGANVFDSKMYRNTLDFTIDADNTEIEIGVEGIFDEIRSWCIVGMFELIDNDQLATMDSPFDVTGYITNPGFEYRNMEGWTVAPDGYFQTQSNNQNFKVGGFYAEKWQGSGALPEGSMTQTITSLPAGYYKLTANLGGNGTYIDLNGKTASWTADKDYTVGYVLSEGENLTITAGKTAEGSANWIHFDNFKLQFCGDVAAALTALCDNVTAYEGKLPEAAYNKLVEDVNALNISYTDVDELLAAIDAVNELYEAADALLAVIDDYNTALERAQAAANTTGKVNEALRESLNSVIAANNPVAEQTADAYVAATDALNNAAATVENSIASYAVIANGKVSTDAIDGWAINTPNGALECNTWSTEADGSGISTPFVQDWIAAGTPLGEGKLYYTFTGLTPGESYSVTALVRAYNESNNSGTVVSGATFYVGNGQKNLDDFGAPCTGNFATKGVFGTLTCAGTVDENGVLEFGIKVNATSPVNWISIDDITIKESSGIVPTAIALDQQSLSLNTGDITTLTATITPDDAEDKTLLWSSSDENVAIVSNGVISAIGAGTATITVNAVAGNHVTASATVTVSDAPGIANKSEVTGTGEFLVRNVATGLYLGAANAWGTQASLVKHGVVLTAKQSGNGYTLTNIVTANSGLGDNAFTDNGSPVAFTLAPVEGKEKVYTLAYNGNYLTAQVGNDILAINGSNATSSLAQWEFIDEEARMANLQAATAENPADATYFLMDPNFSRVNGYYGSWTFEASNKNNAGENENFCVESYHSTFSMNQEIIVPNGTYRITAQGFYRQDGSDNDNLPYFFANNEKQNFPLKTGTENSMADASASFSAGLYTIEPITVEVTDHVLNIGAKNESNTNLWCIWDNFEVEMLSYSEDQDIIANVSAAGYTTLYYSKLNLTVPEGVEVYGASVNDRKIELNAIDADVIPSGTGVVIKAAQGEYRFPVSYANEVVALEAGNELQGTDEATTVAEEGFKYYVLSLKKGGNASTIGFYFQVEGGESVNNGAHKAYLAVPAEQAGNITGFDIETLTGISDMQLTRSDNGEAYSLSGVRMKSGNLPKGLYIIGGKKTVIK